MREVVSGSVLHQCLNMDYLHSGVASFLNSQMMRSLGVQTLNTQHLLEVGKTIVARLSSDDNDGNMLLRLTWYDKVHKLGVQLDQVALSPA